MVMRLALLAFAGACGTICRYVLAEWVKLHLGNTFPYSTWLVNILGCFAFGFFWALGERFGNFSFEARLIILVGFMGAFTTFSTYIFESSELLRSGMYVSFMMNLLGQNLLGFSALYAGMFLARSSS